MDEQEFRTRSAQALDDLSQKLASASDNHDFDADFNSGWRIDVSGGTGEYIVVLSSAGATGDDIFADDFE